MRLFISISVAVSFAAASLTVRGEQAPDKFIVGCPLPFDTISLHRPLDTTCENEGRPKPEDGVLVWGRRLQEKVPDLLSDRC